MKPYSLFFWCVKQFQLHSNLFRLRCLIIITRTIVLYHICQGSQAIYITVNQKLAGTGLYVIYLKNGRRKQGKYAHTHRIHCR